jgi:redox-sensitive bicupin YhaK (pirin superfamily)
MRTVYHEAKSRGHANHGWLDTYHTFSFANYYNPDRIHFGVLRVLNDDSIAGGGGFGMHPHDNMEIITIPLSGDLEHRDNMGNVAVISEGEIQVMSAGTGIFHSEYNKNKNKDATLLQIWVFPREKNLNPRYNQVKISDLIKKDKLFQIVSPDKNDDGAWINQDAWFHLGEFQEGIKETYSLKGQKTGVYIFVIDGKIKVEGNELNKRDGIGFYDVEKLEIESIDKSYFLVMEVPV